MHPSLNIKQMDCLSFILLQRLGEIRLTRPGDPESSDFSALSKASDLPDMVESLRDLPPDDSPDTAVHKRVELIKKATILIFH